MTFKERMIADPKWYAQRLLKNAQWVKNKYKKDPKYRALVKKRTRDRRERIKRELLRGGSMLSRRMCGRV
jgi:hypothetical protein